MIEELGFSEILLKPESRSEKIAKTEIEALVNKENRLDGPFN